MRLRFTILVFLGMLGVAVAAQRYPLKAIHAFKQRVVEGKNDAYKKQRSQRTLYHIYLEQQPNTFITITSVWINGQQYSFDTASVVTPVMIEETLRLPSKKETTKLVAATSNKVVRLVQLKPMSTGRKQPSRFQYYELLIAYTVGNKTYYAGSKFKELQPKLMR
ncbi:MAG: hypothetical protein KGZ74_03120 [Chitinophagaceae bacterium]|nr:hypothetical protein [Chitinophagaceae bacterium]